MYRPVLVTPPDADAGPVTMAALKAHVGASDYADDDDMLKAFLSSAVQHLDGWSGILGRCLMPQTWRQDFDCFERCLRLPLAPVQSITSVQYEDAYGATQTIDGANFALATDALGSFVRFKSTYDFAGVSADRPAVHVTYLAGYIDVASVPAPLKTAILLLVGHWYENRSAVVVGAAPAALPFAVDALIAPFRRMQF